MNELKRTALALSLWIPCALLLFFGWTYAIEHCPLARQGILTLATMVIGFFLAIVVSIIVYRGDL